MMVITGFSFITFLFWWSGKQHFPRQFQLAGFRININELDFNLIAFLQYFINSSDLTPVYFRNMKQPVFIGQYLDKCSKLDNSLYFTLIDLSDFRNGNNLFNPIKGSGYGFLVFPEYVYIAIAVNFFNY